MAADELVALWCAGAKARFKGSDEKTHLLVVERCVDLMNKVVTETIRNAPSFSDAPKSSETLVVAGGQQADETLATLFILSIDSEDALLKCADASLHAFAARVEIVYALYCMLRDNFNETVLDHLSKEDENVLREAFQGDGECDATAAITAVSDEVRTAQFAYGCMIHGDSSDFLLSFAQLEDIKDFIYKPDGNGSASVDHWVDRCESDNPIRVVVSSVIEKLYAIVGDVEDVLNETRGEAD